MIETDLFTLLTGNPAIKALIGNRIFPLLLPDDCAKPAVSYQLISTVRDYDLDGPTGMQTVRIQFDCWGSRYAEARAVSAAIAALLDGFAGELATCEVLLATADGEQAGYDQNERAPYVQQDWLIMFVPR